METEIKEKISRAFFEVLETMVFMFGEAVEPADVNVFPSDCVQAEMTFSGHTAGKITLVVPTEMCLEISANVLGKDQNEALKTVIATDAVKELVNITGGKIATELYGETPVFIFHPPEVVFPDMSIWDELRDNPDTIFFRVDEWVTGMKVEIKV